MDEIYLIIASDGKYDDYWESVQRAYLSKEMADRVCERIERMTYARAKRKHWARGPNYRVASVKLRGE